MQTGQAKLCPVGSGEAIGIPCGERYFITESLYVSKPSLKAERGQSGDIEFTLSLVTQICRGVGFFCHSDCLLSAKTHFFRSSQVENDGSH